MSAFNSGANDCPFEVLREDGEFVYCRARRVGADGVLRELMAVVPAAEHPAVESVKCLIHEYELRDCLDGEWALRPVELVRERRQTMLFVEYPQGDWLDLLIGQPMEIGTFLRLAVALSATLGRLHAGGLVHCDIKPGNVIVNSSRDRAWLTGFGVASRVPRNRQTPGPPEFIAGSLAYMAPEQTGRMNRSVDSRSDLYSLGVALYEMLTGSLPFTASDPMELVHCHIALEPVPPRERLERVPSPVSAIIMKLLAKTAEGRFQSAAGAEHDLRRCLSEWEASRSISDFDLGEHDTPDRLMIPEKLYGRDCEIDALLEAFDRVVAGGRAELVLVSGYSGIGKSAIVNELHKSLVPPRGLFTSGKFDQYKRDIPYATLAQAFQSLIRPLLSKREEELSPWREALRDALSPNGALVVELVPELQYLIGEQPPVPDLPPQDAHARFRLALRCFIGVFARPEHPLAMFLDDLQWLDAATLDLLEDLMSREDLRHLLLIGAYRDNEVSATHPLMRKLEAMRQSGSPLRNIVLSPLRREDIEHLLRDALRCEAMRVAPLAELLYAKTAGNPFFAIQFIAALAEETLLTFDYERARWVWDLKRIEAKGYTDNVVDLLVGKLSRLPLATQKALQQFACLGNSAEFEILRMFQEGSSEEMHGQLWEAVRAGLVFRSETSYRFLHDRVQEAAYSLIPKERRAREHLRMGNLLVENTPAARRDEFIFEIVNQLNRSLHLLSSIADRERVATLNLAAARRAKASTAFVSALKYLQVGRSLLTEETWGENYDLVFSIESLMAECELLIAELAAAEKRLTLLSRRARPGHDFAVVTRLQLTLYTTLDRSETAIEIFLDYLRRNGTDWPKHPARCEVMSEYDRIWSLVGSRRIEELVDLPLLTDPDVIDMLDVFTEIVHPAMFYDENLSSLAVCRMVSLSLEHGNGDGSCFGYVWFAMFAGPRFGNYKDGFRFGQLGYDLVETRGFARYQARTYITFSTLMPWARHASNARELVRRAFDVACRMGDLTFSAYSWHVLITNCLFVGDSLELVQSEVETGLTFATKQGFGLVAANCGAQLGLVRTLRGLTRSFGSFDADDYSESETERHLAANPGLALAEFFYWTRKLQARFFAEDYAAAVDAAQRARRLLWPASSQVETGDFRFYGALAHAAAWSAASGAEKQRHFEALIEHHRQLEVWAGNCPENFENRATLVAAEIARIEGRALDAEQLYERAICLARVNGFVHNEAVASELAARFHRARGLATIADGCLRDALVCYGQWGARGKLNQLHARHPHLRAPRASSLSTAISNAVAHLDAETVVKASQTLSSEMNPPSFIEKLMRLAVENAGAERGLLILSHSDGLCIEAEATIGRDKIDVAVRQVEVTASDLPQSVLQYVLRARERLVFDDVSASAAHADDPYVQEKRPRSLLCLPILTRTKVVGALYLENTLTESSFTSDRVAVLEFIASQAAISLENARLYSGLTRSEALLAEAQKLSLTGSFGWNAATGELFWSEQNYAILELDRTLKPSIELVFSRCHPDDISMVQQMLEQATREGANLDFGHRLLMPDGRIKHVHVMAHIRGDAPGGQEFVGAIMDVTASYQSRIALSDAREELAHVARITTMGELAASIAHEVNQPLGAIVANANACLRWLSHQPPKLDEARESVRQIILDGNRGSEVVTGIRTFLKREQPHGEALSVNDVIRGIIALLRNELREVAVQVELADDLPLVVVDRVQLQQVLLNLTMNAIDAMKPLTDAPRILRIETRHEEGHGILVAVQDSGIGLDAGQMQKLFEPFYTTKPQGLGMGLSICRTIIERHGGCLWMEHNEGPGATFKFSCLPREEDVPT